jgi:hypothetical protein
MILVLNITSKVEFQSRQQLGKPMNLSTSKRNDRATELKAQDIPNLMSNLGACLACKSLAVDCTTRKLSYINHPLTNVILDGCTNSNNLDDTASRVLEIKVMPLSLIFIHPFKHQVG